VEASRSVDGLNVFGHLHKRFDFSIGNVLGGGELDALMVAKKGALFTKKRSPKRVTCLFADRIWGGTAT
jgi:hypothetical protein